MEMKRILLCLLMFMLCGCENHIGDKMYVVGIGFKRDEIDTLYLVVVDGTSEVDFKVISEDGNNIDEMINKLEKKYNSLIEFNNTSFIVTNTYDKDWLINILEDITIDYDCKYSYSDMIDELFTIESKSLVDDIINIIYEEQTLINFLKNNWNSNSSIQCNEKEVYMNESKRTTK